jgi:hypothetical protein
MANCHTPLILVSPLESPRSTGSTCVLLVLPWVNGIGPAFTREVPSPWAKVGYGSIHGVEPHNESVGRHNCASPATMVVTCSGEGVPKATIVSPIMISERPSARAIPTAPVTSPWAPSTESPTPQANTVASQSRGRTTRRARSAPYRSSNSSFTASVSPRRRRGRATV